MRLALVALLVLAACSAPQSPWQELAGPAPGARILSFVPVGGELLVLGSVPGPEGRAPAAWTTTDGRGWRAVPVEPHSPYAFQAELAAAGVADGSVTVLGQAFGGAHGNPRMTVWRGDVHGLTEHPQAFELFGGPHAIAVSDAAAVPGTALLAGQWDGASGRYGAAIWLSPDGVTWQRRADDPVLASARGEQTSAVAATAGPSGFLLTGNTQQASRLVPLVWTSPDGGTWRRIELPATESAVAQRAACDGAGCVVLGSTAGSRPHALCWPRTDAPGSAGPEGADVETSQVVVRAAGLLAALRIDGHARLASLNRDCTAWRDIPLPARTTEIRLAALPGAILVAATEATTSRLFLRAVP